MIEQHYSEEDDRRHISWLTQAFRDGRYIRVNGKPLFLVYRAGRLPDVARTTAIWREEARRRGVGELFLCRVESTNTERGDPAAIGFDAAVEFQPNWHNLGRPLRRDVLRRALWKVKLLRSAYQVHRVYDYAAIVERMLRQADPQRLFYEGQKLKLRLTRLVEAIERVTGARPGTKLQVDFLGSTEIERAISRASRRLALAAVSAASLVGGATTAAAGTAGWISVAFGAAGALLGGWLVVDLGRRQSR